MSAAGQARGQPLFALLAVLAGWIGGRAANWEAPVLAGANVPAAEAPGAAATPGSAIARAGEIGPQSLPGDEFYPSAPTPPAGSGQEAGVSIDAPPRHSGAYAQRLPPRHRLLRYAGPGARTYSGRTYSGWYLDPLGWHLSAGMPGPAEGADYGPDRLGQQGFGPAPALVPVSAAAPRSVPPVPVAPRTKGRWSADTWALFRNDLGAARSRGILPAVYGGSQAGAVLRYRLDTASRFRPSAYLRGTAALGIVQETTAALGLSARPVPSLPVVVALEGRLSDEGHASVQPAVLAYTELPPIRLPLELRAETYLQAGYVGGRFATPFADGQLRIDRRVMPLGRGELRLGGGVWGGAQKDAARLDAGPSASVQMAMGHRVFSRVAVDWRFRVAGDAAPGSGPVVTLSAGF